MNKLDNPLIAPLVLHCVDLVSNTSRFRIHRLGWRESMQPGIVKRPFGTGDTLIMLFHDRVRLGTPDGFVWTAPGALMVWPDGAGHVYGNPDQPWRHTWVHCQGRLVEDMLGLARIPRGFPMELPDWQPTEEMVVAMGREINDQALPDGEILQVLFQLWVLRLGRQLRVSRGEDAFVPEQLQQAKQLLDAELGTPLALDDLAANAGWSRSHFSALFRQHFGCSPIAYQQQRRLRAAGHLLRNHNERIAVIARQVGYQDAAYFSRQFRQFFGCSPRDWRNREP